MAFDAEVITRQNPLLMFQRVLCRATLLTFRLYDLPHTFTSLLLSAATPLLFVSQALGHTNPTTTLKYYAHWIPTGGRRYVDVLDGAADQSWHQAIDLTTGRLFLNQRARDLGQLYRPGRIIALMRHPYKLLSQPQSANHFGRTRQERHNSHWRPLSLLKIDFFRALNWSSL